MKEQDYLNLLDEYRRLFGEAKILIETQEELIDDLRDVVRKQQGWLDMLADCIVTEGKETDIYNILNKVTKGGGV